MQQLPLADPARDFSTFKSIEQASAKRAVDWAKRVEPKLLADRELERLFGAKLERETRAALPACVPEAKEALAVSYARQLRADEAREITALLGTGVGPRLARFLQAGTFFTTLEDCAYRVLFPRLPAILASAVESNDLRRLANSRSSNSP